MDNKYVYAYSEEIARENGEYEIYQKSNELNTACALAVDKAISDNNYKPNHYNFSKAATELIEEYGLDRLVFVLLNTIQQSFNDGRYSNTNKNWAKSIEIPRQKNSWFVARTHPYVLDGLIDQIRIRYVEMITEAIGQYEESHHMAERNRLTWTHTDVGAFVANPGVTMEKLTERYNEILEKKTSKNKRGLKAKTTLKPLEKDE